MVEEFNRLRPYLFAVAYRMVGTVMDAEDILQEVYLRWQALDREEVEQLTSPKAYLTRMVTNLAIDHLRSAQVRREEYVGPWLPEPLLTREEDVSEPAVSDHTLLNESLSTAFLVMLERLNPVERAIFLLHDVFDYDYNEIAPIVGKSESNTRQIGRRAREHVSAHRPRFEPSAEKRDHLFQQFMQAVSEGDVPGLVNLLAEDITVWADGGGKATAARRPITGAEKVARFLANLPKNVPEDTTVTPAMLNGEPGLLAYTGDVLLAAMILHIEQECIQSIHVIANPDKLQRLAQEMNVGKW